MITQRSGPGSTQGFRDPRPCQSRPRRPAVDPRRRISRRALRGQFHSRRSRRPIRHWARGSTGGPMRVSDRQDRCLGWREPQHRPKRIARGPRRVGLVTVTERRRRSAGGAKSLTNVVEVISGEWRSWLKLGAGWYRVQNNTPRDYKIILPTKKRVETLRTSSVALATSRRVMA
jgi:hypothetical protein